MKKRRHTEEKKNYRKYDKTEYGLDVTFPQDDADQLCKGFAERHDAQATESDGHDEKERIPARVIFWD